MRITNLKVYAMHNSIRASGSLMKARLDFEALTAYSYQTNNIYKGENR